MLRIRNVYTGPDFSIPDPGSKVKKACVPDTGLGLGKMKLTVASINKNDLLSAPGSGTVITESRIRIQEANWFRILRINNIASHAGMDCIKKKPGAEYLMLGTL